MVETFLKLIFTKMAEHLEGINTAAIVILTVVCGRNEYRVTELKEAAKKRTVEDCDKLMGSCSAGNNRRFDDGRREFDGFTGAMNRLADHVEDDIKTTNDKLDKTNDKLDRLIEHLLPKSCSKG